ncbi:MAG: DUF4129 domain-containing protein [Oscillospiraceae bacterium]|nr:DUF4129 domain-containing protein [Oscillospiraceae bacterium]
MKTKSSCFLWVLCVCAFPLTIWPLLYGTTIVGIKLDMATVFRDADAVMAVKWLLPCIVSAWLGVGASFLRRWLYAHSKKAPPVMQDRFEERVIEEEKHWMIVLSNLLLLVPFIAAIVWTIVVFSLELVNLFGLLGMIFCGLYAIRTADKAYAEILPRFMLAIALGCGFLAVLFTLSLGASYDPALLIWPFFLEAVICAVAQNQGNIDFMMQRRKHDLSHLPRRVRLYSLFVTGVILVLLLAVVVFRSQITWLFGQLLEVLKVLAKGLILFILWLMGLGDAGNEEVGSDPPGGGQMEGFMEPGAGASPWWDYIMYTILAVVAVFLLVAYRRDIVRAFRDGWRRIKGYIKDKLYAVPVVQKIAEIVESKSEYYTDEIEIMTIEETEHSEDVFRYRDWKKKVRRSAAEAPSRERYRKGYALGLQWLQWKGVNIAPADTPAEILGKAKSVLSAESWGAVTEFYELVRYGEQDAPAEHQTKLFDLLMTFGKK